LAVAAALRDTPLDCTLRYVLFTGEEQGLYGSYFYARDLADRDETLMGVLNLDMIGYDAVGDPILDLHTRPGQPPEVALADTFVSVVRAYQLPLTPTIVPDGITYSDHASFWNAGYAALLAIEDDADFNPYYHTANDRLDKLNLTYMTAVTRAVLATIAHAGCLLAPLP
jgi:Zn-dependent M28 family amino/carboxypeptidase